MDHNPARWRDNDTLYIMIQLSLVTVCRMYHRSSYLALIESRCDNSERAYARLLT